MQTKARILCFALVKLHWKFVRRPAPSICVICRERNMLDLFSLPNMRSIFILTFARKFALKRQKEFSATCSVYLSYPEDKMFQTLSWNVSLSASWLSFHRHSTYQMNTQRLIDYLKTFLSHWAHLGLSCCFVKCVILQTLSSLNQK